MASNPANGLWPVSEDGTKWALADLTGQIVHSLGESRGGAGPYQDGLLWFASPKGGIGYWDRSGRVVIQPQFSSPDSFRGGVARVSPPTRGEQGVWRPWGFMRKDGTFLVPPVFEYVSEFFDGVASVRKGNEVWLIDSNGRPFWPTGVPAIEGARSDIQQLAGWTWRVAKSTNAKDGILGATLALNGDRIEGIRLLDSRERAGADEVKFDRTSDPGVVRVPQQSGQPADWQFIAYGEEVVFFDENRAARLLTRVAQHEKLSEPAAKSDRSGSIIGGLGSVFSGGASDSGSAAKLSDKKLKSSLQDCLDISKFSLSSVGPTFMKDKGQANVEFEYEYEDFVQGGMGKRTKYMERASAIYNVDSKGDWYLTAIPTAIHPLCMARLPMKVR